MKAFDIYIFFIYCAYQIEKYGRIRYNFNSGLEENMITEIKTIFNQKFGYEPTKTYYSPGRVNIIGGHTDYNGGHVLPFCISLGIYAAVSYRDDAVVNIYSKNIPDKGIVSFGLDELEYDEKRDFANYASGVFKELIIRKYNINKGFDLALVSNLPTGGGLSSSAAFLVLICKILNDQFNLGLDGTKMALISKTVENQYIGVSCGIMDQFIIANGKANTAIFLNASNLNYEYVPFKTDEYKFVLVNSNITRKLVESKYNVRQRESQEVLEILKQHVDIDNVCDVCPCQYEELAKHIDNPDLKKRFKHLIDENYRVKLSKVALANNDFVKLGSLLNEAHISVRDLYEVSSEVLDELVELATKSGSLGSKMIGGGFGGSTLNIIKADELDKFIETFTKAYMDKYNLQPIINLVEITDGVKQIND